MGRSVRRCNDLFAFFTLVGCARLQLGVHAADVALAASLTRGKVGVCRNVAQMVDEACQGAPDDRGAAIVTNWLQGLACVSASP
jgi:hypothetical protein